MSEDGWLIEQRYPITCPRCGAELNAATSMAMGLGMNMGRGFHKECGTSFSLRLTPGAWGKPISEQPTGMVATLNTETE